MPSSSPAPRRRSERLEARLTIDQKALVERAAALEGRSVTDFVVSSVQDAAKRSIQEHEQIRLSVRDSETLVAALLNPREPNAVMRSDVAHHGKLVRRS